MLSEKLKELRTQKKINQTQLANLLNVSPKTISAWELGNREPSITMINKISDIFNVQVGYLISEKNNAPKWATKNDVIELDKFLTSNGAMTFEGVQLTKSQKERVKKILTEVFWEELKKDRDNGVR
ncbi:helix-turn-helix transcriptional regulator (plasmid) [Fructilactobacillus vespulae]|uniref:helix-turn-helix domain-containing protein n=1 Tax=Fructilactobacillus vespulae TaxID=1249630 RepID=UPI0039B4E330